MQVERSSLQMLRMKEQMKDFGTELDATREEQETQREVIKAVEDILQAIQEAMIQAVESDETEMYSDLVHDQAQVVEIEELKTRVSSLIIFFSMCNSLNNVHTYCFLSTRIVNGSKQTGRRETES